MRAKEISVSAPHATALYSLRIVVTLFVKVRKSHKFYCLESVPNLVSFLIRFIYFWMFLVLFL